MEFRRGGQRDERRRRVLMEEMLATSDSADGSDSNEDGLRAELGSGRTYSDAALVQYQPRVSCVIPKRIWGMLAVLLAGGIAIAGIELLYTKVLPLVTAEPAGAWRVLDPAATGSLASWFASLTLFLGTLGCFLVYSIRRHRLDDYRGRYSVWVWAAGVFLLASFDAATHAHQALTPLLVAFTGTTLLADGAIWATIALTILFGSVMIRIAFEVWSCPAATSFVALAAVLYLVSAVFTHHQVLHDSVALPNLVASSTLLSGHFSLLYAVLVFARHVYLEAQGERRSTRSTVPQAAATSKATAKAAAKPKVKAAAKPKAATNRTPDKTRSSTTRSKSVRVDDAHEPKEAPAKKAPTPVKQAPVKQAPVRQTPAKKTPARQTVPAAEQESERPMSKAERRRLRKLERRQKRGGADSDE